jgi:hypothetical protein
MVSAEQPTTVATTPAKPHIATAAIEAIDIIDTLEFRVKTVRTKMSIEHFEKASAI